MNFTMNATAKKAFELGCVESATTFAQTCVKNAFPTFNFREFTLTRFLPHNLYLEARSLNHQFVIKSVTVNKIKVWEVYCHRVSMGASPDKQVLLDYESLEFATYTN